MVFEAERGLVARRDGEIVGTAGILTRQLAIPVAPSRPLTSRSSRVAATARRQGVLTRFMQRQFDDARAAGESIAVLWATEGRIYQRFGYGLSATKLALTIQSREGRAAGAPPPVAGLREASPSDIPRLAGEVVRPGLR